MSSARPLTSVLGGSGGIVIASVVFPPDGVEVLIPVGKRNEIGLINGK